VNCCWAAEDEFSTGVIKYLTIFPWKNLKDKKEVG
jgi:hypothetical protein